MAKPSSVPAWATAGTNNTEPSAPQKASGWTTGQVGVSSYDNWWKAKTKEWLDWLDVGGYAAEALTWTAQQIFNAAIKHNGPAADDALAFYSDNVSIGDRKLRFQMRNSLTAYPWETRFYQEKFTGSGGGFTISMNARWDVASSTWIADTSAFDSKRIRVDRNGLYLQLMSAGSMPCTEAAWLATVGRAEHSFFSNGTIQKGGVWGGAVGSDIHKIHVPAAGKFIREDPLLFAVVGYVNSWQGGASLAAAAGCYRTIFGDVIFFGTVRSGVYGTVITTLPTGYRPTHNVYIPIVITGGPAAYLFVSASTGEITINGIVAVGGSMPGEAVLDGVRFSVPDF